MERTKSYVRECLGRKSLCIQLESKIKTLTSNWKKENWFIFSPSKSNKIREKKSMGIMIWIKVRPQKSKSLWRLKEKEALVQNSHGDKVF